MPMEMSDIAVKRLSFQSVDLLIGLAFILSLSLNLWCVGFSFITIDLNHYWTCCSCNNWSFDGVYSGQQTDWE